MQKPANERLLALRARDLTDEIVAWDQGGIIPRDIASMLATISDATSDRLAKWLCRNSEICRIISENPASDAMLRIVYPDANGHPLTDGVDRLLSRSLSGQALRDRLNVCSPWLARHFCHPDARILDLGGGSGNYALHALRLLANGSGIPLGLTWDHLDTDAVALNTGATAATQKARGRFIKFRHGNFMSDKSFPATGEEYDYGVLIGVLCSLDRETAVNLLKRVRSHFKPGAEMLAATLTAQSFAEDPVTFRILCNIVGWDLRPKTLPEIRELFESAGWEVINILSERGERPGQYAIVHARMA